MEKAGKTGGACGFCSFIKVKKEKKSQRFSSFLTSFGKMNAAASQSLLFAGIAWVFSAQAWRLPPEFTGYM